MEVVMLIHQTMEKLAQMKLTGLLEGIREQIDNQGFSELSFEERFGLLVDKEFVLRENRRLTRRLQESRLKIQAEIENIDFQASRGLDKSFFLELAACSWIHNHHNLIITGPTGVGKTYLACALAHKACREGYRSIYYHFPKLLTDLAMSKAEGTYHKLAFTLAKRDLLIIDDWLRDPLTAEQARYILDLFDDRFRNSSTLLSSQFPVSSWHERFKDPTLADAIMDRIVHDSYRLKLKGDSMRKTTSPLT
jgi:DNA replication protein DnaC